MDQINEFDDMVLGAAYLADKLYNKYKKRKKLQLKKRLRKRFMKKENKQLDVYLENIQEGFFNNLNCKRLKSALNVNVKDFKESAIIYKKHCNKNLPNPNKHCKVMKDTLKGLKLHIDSLKEKIKKNCTQ